jgi:hypothetical protein
MGKATGKDAVIIPWKTILGKSSWHTSYIDYVEGSDQQEVRRYIFIPYEENGLGIGMCMTNAYNLALLLFKTEKWKGFEVLLKVGKDIGQEIDCLYIELLPIRDTPKINVNNVQLLPEAESANITAITAIATVNE